MYDEQMFSTFVTYAEAIKEVDPSAKVMGHAVSGGQDTCTRLWIAAMTIFGRMQTERRMGTCLFWPGGWRPFASTMSKSAAVRLTCWIFTTIPRRRACTHQLTIPPLIDADCAQRAPCGTRAILTSRGSARRFHDSALARLDRPVLSRTHLSIGEWNWGADTQSMARWRLPTCSGSLGVKASIWQRTGPPAPSQPVPGVRACTPTMTATATASETRLSPLIQARQTMSLCTQSRDSTSGDLLLMAINQRPDADVVTRIQLGELGASRMAAYRYAGGAPGIQALGDTNITDSGDSEPCCCSLSSPITLRRGFLSQRLQGTDCRCAS